MKKAKTAKTIVHVNQHMLKHNQKHGTEFPVLTVKHRGKTYYGHEVIYHDSSTTKYQPKKPLSCGAVCWVETEGEVTIFETYELVKDSDERFDTELSTAIQHEMAKNPSEWKQNEDTRYQEDPENWVE